MLRYRLHIVSEYHYRVKHCLLALHGVDLSEVKEVYSHPQALAQCEESIKKLKLKQVPQSDTAGSARLLQKTGLRTASAIASKHAASVYNLAILEEGIEDNPANFTRFLLLAKNPTNLDQSDPHGYKTSIAFTLTNKPGSLFKALSVFALRDIDLSKIESRPIAGKPWEYMFYIDFIGHLSDDNCQRALDHLHELAPFLRVFGSYKRHIFEMDTNE